MQFLNIVFLVLILVVFLGFLVLLGLWQWSLAITRAPFIGIAYGALPSIVDALELAPGSVVYDLGCGDGRVLCAAQIRQTAAKYIGIDKAVFPLLCARWKTRRLTKPPLFLRKNFFKTDFSDATIIFTYLFPQVMDDLLPILEKKLKPGTRLVSCDFPFTKKEAKEIILIPPHKGLGKKLFVYIF